MIVNWQLQQKDCTSRLIGSTTRRLRLKVSRLSAACTSQFKVNMPKQMVDIVYLRVYADQRLRLLHRHAFRDLLKSRYRGRQASPGAGLARGVGCSASAGVPLLWAESVTRVAQTSVPDADYEAAAAGFSDKELARSLLCDRLDGAPSIDWDLVPPPPAAAKAWRRSQSEIARF